MAICVKPIYYLFVIGFIQDKIVHDGEKNGQKSLIDYYSFYYKDPV